MQVRGTLAEGSARGMGKLEAPDLQRGESRNLWTGMRGWSPGMYREKHTLE